MGNKNLPISWEEDGYTVTRTTAWSAPGCHAGCGVVCYVNEEEYWRKSRAIGSIRSIKDTSARDAHAFLMLSTGPRTALLYPMKRDPPSAGNPDAWERVSWDEALDLIYDEMTRLGEEYGRYTLQTFCGTGRDILWQVQRPCLCNGARRTSKAIPPV